MAPKIPDRWLDYKAVGERVEGTRFIAFKVPLKPHLCDEIKEKLRFDGRMLLENIPDLGVIIDLTNTNRYYDPRFFEDEGVEHKKLMIPGHVTPPQRLVDIFKNYVKQFIQSNPDNGKLIGVHCTHGVNRTGFLICNYMVSEMAVEPNHAINKFNDARGHKIERKNYLDALQELTPTEGNASNSPDNKRATDRRDRKSSSRNSTTDSRRDPSRDRKRKYQNNDNSHNDFRTEPTHSKRMRPHEDTTYNNRFYNQQCNRSSNNYANMEFRGRRNSPNDNHQHNNGRYNSNRHQQVARRSKSSERKYKYSHNNYNNNSYRNQSWRRDDNYNKYQYRRNDRDNDHKDYSDARTATSSTYSSRDRSNTSRDHSNSNYSKRNRY